MWRVRRSGDEDEDEDESDNSMPYAVISEVGGVVLLFGSDERARHDARGK